MLPANFKALFKAGRAAHLILDNEWRDYVIRGDGNIDFASEEIRPIDPTMTVEELMKTRFGPVHRAWLARVMVKLDEKETEEFFEGLVKSKL